MQRLVPHLDVHRGHVEITRRRCRRRPRWSVAVEPAVRRRRRPGTSPRRRPRRATSTHAAIASTARCRRSWRPSPSAILEVDVGDDDPRALDGHARRGRAPDARARARDDADLAVEQSHRSLLRDQRTRDRLERDRHVGDAAPGNELVADHAGFVDVPVAERLDELLERDAGLEPGDGVAEAVVDAVAERVVRPGALAGDVEPVGVVEDGLVVVRRPEQHQHPRALGDRDAVHLDVARRGAGRAPAPATRSGSAPPSRRATARGCARSISRCSG